MTGVFAVTAVVCSLFVGSVAGTGWAGGAERDAATPAGTGSLGWEDRLMAVVWMAIGAFLVSPIPAGLVAWLAPARRRGRRVVALIATVVSAMMLGFLMTSGFDLGEGLIDMGTWTVLLFLTVWAALGCGLGCGVYLTTQGERQSG